MYFCEPKFEYHHAYFSRASSVFRRIINRNGIWQLDTRAGFPKCEMFKGVRSPPLAA